MDVGRAYPAEYVRVSVHIIHLTISVCSLAKYNILLFTTLPLSLSVGRKNKI